jgi:hypothetical protein
MSWNDYFLRHVEEAERKARELSGFARVKQHVVAETFRGLARDEFVGRRDRRQRRDDRAGSRVRERF